MQQGREGEGEQRQGEREHRVEAAGRQPAAAQQQRPEPADRGAQRAAHQELHHDLDGEPGEAAVEGVEAAGSGAGDRQGEQHRHRVVEAGLELQGGADPAAQLEAAAAQHREQRRGVGRGDHGAEQQGLRPGEAEQVRRQGDQGADREHPQRRQRRRRRERPPDCMKRRVEAAVEEDQGERQGAEPEGQAVVLEGDAAQALRAGQHAHRHEEQEDGDAEAPRGAAEQHADRQHQAQEDQQPGDVRELQLGGHGGRSLPGAGAQDCGKIARLTPGRSIRRRAQSIRTLAELWRIP